MPRTATEEDFDIDGDLAFPMTIGKPSKYADLIDGDDEDDEDELDPMVLALQGQIEQMTVNNDKDREFFQTQLNNIIAKSGQPQQQQQDGPDPTQLNLDDLPDPVEEKEAFNKELATRFNKALKASNTATAHAVNAVAQNTSDMTDLETRFKTSHKELAAKPALFDAVLRQEISKVKARGLDPKQFVFADPDKFLNTVAEKMKSELGIEDEDLDEDDLDEEEDEPRRKAPRKLAKKRTSRTLGVSSGSRAKVGRKKKRSNGKTLSFVDQLKKQQVEMGLM